MELFNASDDDQWTLIKRVIDESDYYLVIIAGRYGSCREDGMGYTEMEYDYAAEKKKPVIAFIHGEPGKIPNEKTEKEPTGKAKLEKFLEKAKRKVAKFWTNPDDLAGKVALSIASLKQTHRAEGWVQAKYASNPQETLRLRARIEELERELHAARTEPPHGAERLSQGGEMVTLDFSARVLGNEEWYSHEVSWDSIFSLIGPLMFHECSEQKMQQTLAEWLVLGYGLPSEQVYDKALDRESLNQIIVQLRALGLIVKSDRKRTASDRNTYWMLTPFGDNYLTQLLAIPRAQS